MFTSMDVAGESLSKAPETSASQLLTELQDTNSLHRSNYEGEEPRLAQRDEGVRPVERHEGVVDPFSNDSMREITISPLNSGYLVRVGCQSVAVETNETLIAALGEYITNPAEFEKKWYSSNKRNRLENIL